MYELKTLLPQFDIKPPTCMYQLKNLSLPPDAAACGPATSSDKHVSATTTTTTTTTAANCVLDLDVLAAQIQQQLKSDSEFEAIVKRQQRMLVDLNELKKDVQGLRAKWTAPAGKTQRAPQKTQTTTVAAAKQTTTGTNGGLREEPLHDVVINGHPNFIPYALLALKNAWQGLFTIDIKTYTHSTMTSIGPDACEFEKKLNAIPLDTTKPKINVTLIWKNCEHTEMISSPTMYVPIYGEVNIIRYFGRIGPAEYRYEDSPLCNELDAVMDICYQLLRVQSRAGQAAILDALNKRLQKQKYFGGDSMSVADIAVHSSLKRMPAIHDKHLTPALREWRKRVQLVTMI